MEDHTHTSADTGASMVNMVLAILGIILILVVAYFLFFRPLYNTGGNTGTQDTNNEAPVEVEENIDTGE